ncbi:MAG TPA: L,D-transpeptidase family protein [Anaerolineales bacterium]|nr:L,D-transpeptidase family protein [Anaerolineales bacterium]
MNRNFSRRDFLKISAAGLGALAFNPYGALNLGYLASPKRLPEFPKSEIIGRIVDPGIDLRSSPTNDPNVNNSIAKLGADTLVEWGRQVIGNVIGGLTNQRYVETPNGFIYSSVLQPTRNLPNTPITEIPSGQPGFWAEVTVPYVDLTHEGVVASPWLQDHILYNFPPRLYYGQVVWMDQIRMNNGFPEYRWNEGINGHGYGYGAYGEFFWGDGAGFKVLTEEDVAPINPEVDPNDKRIEADLDYQTLSCYEGNTEVYFCRISSGIGYDPETGQTSEKLATPVGNLLTHWKIISENMTAGSFQSGYSTPAVPWTTMISGDGVAIHGAFWHNAFGEKRSHGCINVSPEDAKWIFRWTTPYVSLAQSEVRVSLPDHGTIVVTSETKF